MRKKDSTLRAFITDYEYEASQLVSKDIGPVRVNGISRMDVEAYFGNEAPEKGVTFTQHGTYSDALEVSDNPALSDYLREVERINKLDDFHPDGADFDRRKKENLAAFVTKESK